MSRFMRPSMEFLEAYTPGEQPKEQVIKLNTNENPFPPSPEVKLALSQMDKDRLCLYSDPEVTAVSRAIAEYYDIETDQVLVTNGSDEALGFAFMAFGREVCYPEISYSFYPVYADVFSTDAVSVPLKDDMTIDLEAFKSVAGTAVIANPNAPTGIALDIGQIRELVESDRNRLVIIDEAYVDFGADSCVPLTKIYDNLVVVQTMSKSRSLAGMRVGYAIGSREILDDLKKVKYSFNPYNVNSMSMIAAAAAMKDRDYFEMTRSRIIETREWIVGEFRKLDIEVLPSKANFFFAKTGADYPAQLRERGILVRHWDRDIIRDWTRVTVGTKEEMEALLKATKAIMCTA